MRDRDMVRFAEFLLLFNVNEHYNKCPGKSLLEGFV